MRIFGISSGSMKALVVAWVLLMLLTIGTAVAGKVGADSHLGPVWLGALAVVTILKARMILTEYLGLYRAPGWRSGFTTTLVVLVGAMFTLAALTPV
ncbi:MAG: cytochrome C oxidase subunit IV family protein [Hyphomicrobiales bacterium]